MTTTKTHWATLFEGLFREAPTGIAEAAIAEAETRLGTRLPSPLRGLYAACGGEPRMMSVFQRILEPEELAVHDGRLIYNVSSAYELTDETNADEENLARLADWDEVVNHNGLIVHRQGAALVGQVGHGALFMAALDEEAAEALEPFGFVV